MFEMRNSTDEKLIDEDSSISTITTIIILSILSICGWIFMSYALFNRSEAYRRKPDDQFGNNSSPSVIQDPANEFSLLSNFEMV